jgi:hypothetical protein
MARCTCERSSDAIVQGRSASASYRTACETALQRVVETRECNFAAKAQTAVTWRKAHVERDVVVDCDAQHNADELVLALLLARQMIELSNYAIADTVRFATVE